jgi:anti-sigma factor RsiW
VTSELAKLRCAGLRRFIDTYLDGEFAEAERLEFDQHLDGCEPCRALVREQATWRRAVRDAAPREVAPAALRERLSAALAAEPVADGESMPTDEVARRRSRFMRFAPYAAAAAVAGALLVTRAQHTALTADVIAKHQRNLPIEVTGRSEEVRRWYADKVDFPVRVPSFGGVRPVAFRGGRLANVRERQAAYLVYDVDGNKVSVFIFDPGEMPIEARRHETIGNREVYLDGDRGYNVALYRDHGVGYAIASDMDQGEMLKLVSVVH